MTQWQYMTNTAIFVFGTLFAYRVVTNQLFIIRQLIKIFYYSINN